MQEGTSYTQGWVKYHTQRGADIIYMEGMNIIYKGGWTDTHINGGTDLIYKEGQYRMRRQDLT